MLGAAGEVSNLTSKGFCAISEQYMLRASSILWEQFVMDVAALLQMDSPVFICSVNHRREKHPRAGVNLVPTCRMDTQILMQRL